MTHRKGFTLVEVLISIGLLGMMIVPLFSVVEMMRMSNKNLLHAVEKSQKATKATKVLFLDILSSDGRLTFKKDEFTRLCIEETTNSFYNLSVAKVCWVVLKEKNTLVRVEGNNYRLPLKSEDRVEVSRVMENIELFDIYHEKDKVLVMIQEKNKKLISFLIQGITNPVARVLGDGTQVFKDGSKILPDGTLVPAPNKKKKINNRKSNTRTKKGRGGGKKIKKREQGDNGSVEKTKPRQRRRSEDER